jgi:thioredoxin 1
MNNKMMPAALRVAHVLAVIVAILSHQKTSLAFTSSLSTTSSQPTLSISSKAMVAATAAVHPNNRRRNDAVFLSHRLNDHDATQHITDANHESILYNPENLPVLIDCYVAKCGPCKIIERSLSQILPKYTSDDIELGYSTRLIFCKWDADEKDESEIFMNIMRKHNYTFRKLPTLVLFVEGVPVAMRSGMATEGQIDRFLDEYLPKPLESLFVPTLRRRNAGGV